jgi:hypothetical protein
VSVTRRRFFGTVATMAGAGAGTLVPPFFSVERAAGETSRQGCRGGKYSTLS